MYIIYEVVEGGERVERPQGEPVIPRQSRSRLFRDARQTPRIAYPILKFAERNPGGFGNSLKGEMSVYPRPAAGAYYGMPQQTYALPAQQPPPSDVRPPGCASSSHSNFTLPPGVPLHANPRDLIAELCKIIERQSQEIVAMRQERYQERGAQAGRPC